MSLYMIEQVTSMPLAKSIFFQKKNAFPNYISNIYFGKNIKCEHWYYKVRTGNALKDHTEAGIRNKYDTCAFGQIHFCKV